MGTFVRKAEPRDAEQIIALLNRIAAEPGVSIGLSPGEFRYSVEQEQEFISQVAGSDNSLFLVAETLGEVSDQDSDQGHGISKPHIVGILTCEGGQRKTSRHAVELGICIDSDWRNQHIGYELMQAAIEWARANTIVKRIELSVFVRNAIAVHLYQKFGFEIEGRRKQVLFREGEFHDDYIMALLLP